MFNYEATKRGTDVKFFDHEKFGHPTLRHDPQLRTFIVSKEPATDRVAKLDKKYRTNTLLMGRAEV